MSLRNASAPPTPPAAAAADPDIPTDAERRAALAKLGALAAWTAPTMLTLMTSARADDFGSPCRPGNICP
jgi:hypothetical protein